MQKPTFTILNKAKIKLFRANLHGVVDKKFFLFRIAMLYGYPPLNFYYPPIRNKGNKDASIYEEVYKKGNGGALAWPFLHLTVLNKKKKVS